MHNFGLSWEVILNLHLECEKVGPWTIVGVAGEIDMANADELWEYLASQVERQHVAVDLSGVRFIDSTGLTALVRTYKSLKQAGGTLLLLSPSPPVLRLLAVTGLDGLFSLCWTVEDLDAVIPLARQTNPVEPAPTVVAG
ncbi:MAG TPA: STAS domain-containing protein [Actinomycetota bacterium]|nr:STAS domain-containing protein [Actinomycetota bacterium]